MKSKTFTGLSFIIVYMLIILNTEANSTTYTVNVMNFLFTPPNNNVSVGDTIKWVWVSGNHTTTNNGAFGSSRPPGAPSWDAPINNSMTQFSYVVTVPGTYVYVCLFHSGMSASFTATNPPLNLNFTGLMEGFWNGTVLVQDTVKIYLHSTSAPYPIKDSAKVKLNASGFGSVLFSSAPGSSYYIVVKHRNTIETWSRMPVIFTPGITTDYDFTNNLNKAYEGNMILKGGKYTFYSGDPNQDGLINLSDVLQIYNSAIAFETGYIVTDVNGDNIADLADILITQNNSSQFVTVKKPGLN